MFFRELEEPLCTFPFYDPILEITRTEIKDEKKNEYYRELCYMLPQPNRTIFMKLLVIFFFFSKFHFFFFFSFFFSFFFFFFHFFLTPFSFPSPETSLSHSPSLLLQQNVSPQFECYYRSFNL